jgi:hypothetical protein
LDMCLSSVVVAGISLLQTCLLSVGCCRNSLLKHFSHLLLQ